MGDQPLKSAGAGTLRAAALGTEVRLAGWVARRRDHGGVLFVDLRDATGTMQVVIDPERFPEAHKLRNEYCIGVAGVVRERPEGTANPDMATGEVEVEVAELTVFSPADPLPFQLDGRADVEEVRRLKYRYLDLRTERMAANLRARSATIRAMRRVLDDLGFLEVETPTLIRSTPEGARDLLVPSRLRQGSFYALPQSPQLFKQLLMIGGVERYYQIARCYRDEDFRADRQVEFTQLDLEGSFWGRDDVLATLEEVMVAVARDVRGVELERPFRRISYADALLRYGTDKPDTRFGMEIAELSDVFAQTGFKAFGAVLEAGGVIRGINAGKLGLSRSGLDGLSARAQEFGAKGLVWAVAEGDGTLRSPVGKYLTDDELTALRDRLGTTPGDTMLVVADAAEVAAEALGKLRLELGRPDGHGDLMFLWVVDFPVFEKTAGGDLVPAHHPFTAPHDVVEMRDDPDNALSHAYDLVLNGAELGSGSVRIHDPGVQWQVFEILGIAPDDAERRFGWFMRALRYGTPPHAGFAVGLDRLISILQNEDNIREVMPFPKTQSGLDPLTGAPAPVDDHQLFDLGLDLRAEVRAAMLADGEYGEEEPPPEA